MSSSGVFLGLFISNGPGDPSLAPELIQNVRAVMDQDRQQPIFGEPFPVYVYTCGMVLLY